MKSKFEVSSIFPTFHKFINTLFGAKRHTLRSAKNTSIKISSSIFKRWAFFIIHLVLTHLNNMGLLQKGKTNIFLMLLDHFFFQMKVPKVLLGGSYSSAAYLINQTSSHVLEYQSPMSKLSTLFPNFQGFGSLP